MSIIVFISISPHLGHVSIIIFQRPPLLPLVYIASSVRPHEGNGCWHSAFVLFDWKVSGFSDQNICNVPTFAFLTNFFVAELGSANVTLVQVNLFHSAPPISPSRSSLDDQVANIV